jgi:hypothetical protein
MTPGGVCCKSVTAADFLGEFVASLNTVRPNLYNTTQVCHSPSELVRFLLENGELALAAASVPVPLETESKRPIPTFVGADLMLTALILICSTAITPDLAACDRANAVDVMRVPVEFGNPVTCFMHGEAYLAETTLGRDLADNERVKIVCVRSQTAAAIGTTVRQPTIP